MAFSSSDKLARADFLVIIAGQRQRKFRTSGRNPAEPIRAETVGIHARAGGQAHRVKILLALGQRVGQRASAQNKCDCRLSSRSPPKP
jgi:hypothetical protein